MNEERLTPEERALLDAMRAASGVPWGVCERPWDDSGKNIYSPPGDPHGARLVACTDTGWIDDTDEDEADRDCANAAYIVAAANAIPGLLDTIAHLREEGDEAREIAREANEMTDGALNELRDAEAREKALLAGERGSEGATQFAAFVTHATREQRSASSTTEGREK